MTPHPGAPITVCGAVLGDCLGSSALFACGPGRFGWCGASQVPFTFAGVLLAAGAVGGDCGAAVDGADAWCSAHFPTPIFLLLK